MKQHRQNLNNIQAPSGLEDRLRHALDRIPAKRKKRNSARMWFAATAAAIVLIVGTYQYPAFAYYSGKLFNKTELNSLSFSEVAEHGYGQSVNKSKTLDDGTVITINGVIADDNALLLYYSIKRPEGSVFTDDYFSRYGVSKMHGFLTDYNMKEGSSNYRMGKSEYEGIYKFDPVKPFSRTLTVTFNERLDNGEQAVYPISFKYDANKAMNSLLKEELTESLPVDRGRIQYDSLTASPTSTMVKGHYEMDNGEFPYFVGQTELLVNGIEVQAFGMRSNGITDDGVQDFELEFDVLPTDKIESVELVLHNFDGYETIEQPISLASPSDRSIRIGTEKLWIRSVTPTDKGYDVVIARKQFTILDTQHLAIQAGGSVVPVSSISRSRPWDLHNGNILWEQTYSFNTKEQPEQLLLDGYHYIKTYDKTISLPIGKR